MRTTLSLDDDVAAMLERVRHKTGASFKETVNTALRQGLVKMDTPHPKRKRFETKPLDVGKLLVPDLDNVWEVVAFAEGEDYK
jgi:hypothetical protein